MNYPLAQKALADARKRNPFVTMEGVLRHLETQKRIEDLLRGPPPSESKLVLGSTVQPTK
jgi:hypothetical protein